MSKNPASKIIVSSADRLALKAARTAGDRYARKSIWARIRTAFGIPTSVKLGVGADNALYVKGSDPRKWLTLDVNGRYNGASTMDAATAAPVAQDAAPIPADAGRFVVAGTSNADTASYGSITVAALLDALRDGSFPDVDAVGALPDGMPAPGDDQVVMDTATSTLYFKQD